MLTRKTGTDQCQKSTIVSEQTASLFSDASSTREALTASAETLLAFSRAGECEDSTLALQFVFVCIY